MMLSSAKEVVVAYGGRRILDRVYLEIKGNEQYAVTGRSGSGKTTLLLVMAGLLPPTGGTVTLGVAPREILYIPQAPSLVPELNASENAALGLRIRGTRPAEARQRADEALASLGLGDALEALPSELSGGMQQRVALARAVVVAPRLLLADEPTGALDRTSGRAVLALLRDVATQQGIALLIATHDAEVAATLPRRISLTDGLVSV
jgi:ABC-type lipoprotein export system ATPase subunit